MLVKVRVQTAVHDFSSPASDVFVPPMSTHHPAFADEPHPELLDRGGHSVDIFTKPDFDIFHGAGTLIVIGASESDSSPFAAADCWPAIAPIILGAPLGEPLPKNRREPIVLTWV